MRAVDTNVLVRFLTADDPQQAAAAKAVIAAGEIFVGVTVLLETEWVLRAGYGFERAEIAAAFGGLAGLPGISLEDPAAVSLALDAFTEGMDFADALHVARSSHCAAFLTFDRRLVRDAARFPRIVVEEIS